MDQVTDNFDCSLCFLSFSSLESVTRHMQDMHEAPREVSSSEFVCSWCGHQFSSYSDLDSHMRGCHQSVMPNAETIGHEEVVQPDFDPTATALLQVIIIDKNKDPILVLLL